MRAAGLSLHEIEALFDTLHARVEAIDPTVNARQPFLDMCHAHFQILNVVPDAIHAFFDPSQTRLDLLQDRNDDIRDLAHARNLLVLCLFSKSGVTP